MRKLALLLGGLLAIATPAPMLASEAAAPATPIAASRFGLYIVAKDPERLALFYTQLFGAPELRIPGLTGFNVAGGLLAIVDRNIYAADAVPGDTVRGYIKVASIDAAFATAQKVTPNTLESKAVIGEGSFRFFRLRDPEGNVIEFFAVGAP